MARGEPVEQATERSVEEPVYQEAEERVQQDKQESPFQQDPAECLDESQPEFAAPEVVLNHEEVMS
jgi:hypothetical protein